MGSLIHHAFVRSAEPFVAFDDPPANDELSGVLAGLSRQMAGEGAILSAHAPHMPAPELFAACVPHELRDNVPALLGDPALSRFVREGAARPTWTRSRLGDDTLDVLMLPVAPVEGHSRLVVSVLMRSASGERRRAAEQLFASRRLLAMGYLRLWQAERVGARRLAALESACDNTDFGILLLTRDGDLTFANAPAGELLEIGDGLRRHRGSVQASDIADSVKLHVALNHAMAANDAVDGTKSARRRAPLVRLRRSNGEPLIAVVVAADQPAVEPGDVAVLVYLFDPTFDMDRVLKPVCSAFQLSPAESHLACHLAAGHSLADAAAALKIKVETARGYLKHIFVKTDTRRQTELVHLMLSNIFRVGRSILPEFL
jgi:DNA-binding CsgD family transcriptional regulator/PAS domain-containing protein